MTNTRENRATSKRAVPVTVALFLLAPALLHAQSITVEKGKIEVTQGNSFNNQYIAVNLNGADYTTIGGNIIEDSGMYGISGSDTFTEQITITGNIIKDGDTNSMTDGISLAHGSYFSITGNIISGASSQGIECSIGTINGTITGNHIQVSGEEGILVRTKYAAVTGNNIYGAGTYAIKADWGGGALGVPIWGTYQTVVGNTSAGSGNPSDPFLVSGSNTTDANNTGD